MKKIILTITAACFAFAAQAQTASVMAIHNSADPALDSVDMYLLSNGLSTKLVDNFAFRNSTGFINAPAGIPIRIVFAGKSSTSIADSVIGFGFNLPSNGKFILAAQGHLQSGFTPQEPFSLNVVANVENSNTAGSNKIAVYHGSTDAPSVDIKAFAKSNTSALVSLASGDSYGDVTAYTTVPNGDYLINVSLPGQSKALFTYAAPLKTLALDGEPVFAFASGFLSPSANNNGKGFGIFVALKDGRVIELPLQNTAKLQVIHNSPDALASSVDVYSNVSGTIQLLINNFAYRTATPFLTVPANTDFTVWIAPGNSTSYTESVYQADVNLYGGTDVAAIATGVIDTTKFENGVNAAFRLKVVNAPSTSLETNKVSLQIVHGSTDAPSVDVRIGSNTGAKLADALTFGNNTALINADANDLTVLVLPAGASNAVATYSAPLSAFRDSGIIILASGFLSPNVPTGKDNGAAFGLYVATASGRMIALPLVTVSIDEINNNSIAIYPNPANDFVFISSQENVVSVQVLSIEGKLVSINLQDNIVDLSVLNTGVYTMIVKTDKGSYSVKLIKE